MKKCSKCGETKTLDEFHNHKATKDGKKHHCKVCRKKANATWRKGNQEWAMAYRDAHKEENKKDKEWRQRQRATSRRWVKKKRSEINEKLRKWRRENKEKTKAHRAVWKAVKLGTLKRGQCEVSDGDCHGGICAHHKDYSKPLEVCWLCEHHHQKLHYYKKTKG